MSATPDDDLKRDLWRQVAHPWLMSHPEHGVDGEASLDRLWGADIDWRPEHLEVMPALIRLGLAPEPQLSAVVRLFGFMPYARPLRETLSGPLLKRIERALGAEDWARLLASEAAVDVLAVDDSESRPLADLLDADGEGGAQVVHRIDLLGAAGLAACFAAFGEPWRLRLGLRLRPAWHEAVLAAAPRPRKQAERRLGWALSVIGLPSAGEMRDGELSDGEAP